LAFSRRVGPGIDDGRFQPYSGDYNFDNDGWVD
jgi:hypothetical protein